MKNKFLSLLITAVMIFSCLGHNIAGGSDLLTVSASAEESSDVVYTTDEEFPLSDEALIIGNDYVYGELVYSGAGAVALSDESDCVSNLGTATAEEIAAEIKKYFKLRESSFVLNFTLSEKPADIRAYINSLFTLALKHTGVPDEGDFLRWQYSCYSWNASYNSRNEFTVTVTLDIFTTKSQEDELTAKVNEILASLDLYGKRNYEKICRIYDYVCQNVTYDWDGLNDDSTIIEHSAYAALCRNTAVCQGYSAAIYRLMLEAGIDCRMIVGTVNGEGHAWNIVKLGSYYYLLDSTFDAGRTSYSYFLKCRADMPQHVMESEFLTAEFMSAYPISEVSYIPPLDDDILYGDVNGDGKILSDDVTLIRKYIVGGWDVDIDLAAADVNCDGKILSDDVTMVRKYIVGGWDVELGTSA